MSPFITYLLKAGIIYSLFFILYFLLFRKETFFKRNRVFLLFSLVLPALIPLVSIPVSSDFGGLVSEKTTSWIMIVGNVISEPASAGPGLNPDSAVQSESFSLGSFFLIFYLLGLSFFIIRIIYNYSRIIRLILSSEKKQIYEMILIITRRMVSPFSIFKWLVIPETQKDHPDLDKIVGHEMVHYKQKHSYDLLLTELVIAFQWFNPFAWMLKSSIVRNNEFLVDQTLINDLFDHKEYQYALLNNSVGQQKFAMVNSFSKGLIKNRIKMMNKRKTRLVNRAKEMLLIPFALMLVLAFSAYTNYATEGPQDKKRKKTGNDTWTYKANQEKSIVKNGTWTYKSDQNKPIVKKDTWTYKSDQEGYVVRDDPWTISQDQDKKKKKKDGKDHITIYVDGEKIMLKGASGLMEKDGDFRIIKISDLDDLDGKSISREKLIERIKEIKSESGDEAVIMIKESEDDGESVDVYALVTKEGESKKKGLVFLKSDEDGHIEISTDEGEGKVIYISKSEGDSKRIHIRSDGKDKDFLIVIDGKISSEEDLENIDSDKIYSITILDSEDAKKEFGDKAKGGVIKVTTKK